MPIFRYFHNIESSPRDDLYIIGRIYAVVKDGQLKHLAYYDENHKQAVSIDFAHQHKGVQPHRHVYLNHDKDSPGVPPTASEEALIRKIKKEFHLR